MEWAAETLDLTMDDELRSLVQDDTDEQAIADRGVVTFFMTITQRLVVQNNEATTALQDYLRGFNICHYDNQDVTVASARIKAVAQALGSDLPSNTISLVLKGFAKASNEDFRIVCQTLHAMLDNYLLTQGLQQISTYKQLVRVCEDMERKYIGLCTTRE